MLVRHTQPLSLRLVASALLALVTLIASSRTLTAQTLRTLPASSQARERMFDEIAAEVAALERQGNLLKRVVQLVTPTVVHIEAEKSNQPNSRLRQSPVEEAGSGVVIKHKGKSYVLTNRHVIKDSRLAQIKIKLADGRVVYPTKVWTDRGTDVAVMAIALDDVIAARLGDSSTVEIGDFVLAVGSPFGLSHSVTYGIISAKGRRDLKLGDGSVKYQNFLQTDAAINPGNSGGPLLNLRGEVIGINTAIASSSGGSEGIGFSIPINMAVRIAQQLIDQGNVVRAYLGVRLDAGFTPSRAYQMGLPQSSGALVSAVTANSPAASAKLRRGDVIMKVGDRRVEDDAHLVNLISLTPVGEAVELQVYRDGKPFVVSVRVGDRDDFERE
jgi:serine protease Do